MIHLLKRGNTPFLMIRKDVFSIDLFANQKCASSCGGQPWSGRSFNSSEHTESFLLTSTCITEGLGGSTMPITFERTICRNLDETLSREWLITNGLGGYAAGTVAGTLTRMQQGLLVAALDEDTAPQLLLAKIDEEVLFDQRTYYLGTNEYRDGTLNPAGFVHLESFRLE